MIFKSIKWVYSNPKMKRIMLTFLFAISVCSIGAETSVYQTFLGGKPIGQVTVEILTRSPGGSYLNIKIQGQVTVLFTVDYGMDASLEYDAQDELISGSTHVSGMGADIAMRFQKDEKGSRVEKDTGNRGWILQREKSFSATTLFFYNPPMIKKMMQEYPGQKSVSLLDIENSRVTNLDYEFSRSLADPWGDVIVMSNRDMTNYFDPTSHKLLYSEVKIMGRKVTTVLQ